MIEMKINKKLIAIIVISIVITVPFIKYTFDWINKTNNWNEKSKTGNLDEIILYNQFPDNELLIIFDDYDYLLVTRNYFGCYSFLKHLEQNTTIKLEYKENGFDEVYVKNIEVIK